MRIKYFLAFIAILFLSMSMTVFAGDNEPRKLALVIGISNYKNVPALPGTGVDADSVSRILGSSGYSVTEITDEGASRSSLLHGYGRFISSINQNDDVVIYYSGHGVEVGGSDFMVPIDSPDPEAVTNPSDLSQQLIDMRVWIDEASRLSPRTLVFLVDACRNNPYAGHGKGLGEVGGLKRIDAGTNVFTWFSARESQISGVDFPHENLGGRLGSPFTRVFVEMFDQYKHVSVGAFAKKQRQVFIERISPNQQVPDFDDGTIYDWCFAGCNALPLEARLTENSVKSNSQVSEGAVPGEYSHVGMVSQKQFGPMMVQDMLHLLSNKPAVFLGKKSAVECKTDAVSDKYPFGCNTLRGLVSESESGSTSANLHLAGTSVVATTPVNLRSSLPHLGGSGAIYGCTIGVISAGDSVQLSATVAIRYADDTFFWGVLDRKSGPCLSH